MRHTPTLAALAAAVAAAFTLAACDQNKPPTVGQQVDQAVASAKDSAQDMKDDAGQAVDKAKQMAGDAGHAVATEAKDLAITAKVNAELAKDKQLSAIIIDVDTRDGHVELKGEAPSAAARNRAAQIASSVDGVVDVENHLTVSRNS